MKYVTLSILLFTAISTNNIYAKSYYIKNGGNNNADGRSDATAWATLARVNKFNLNIGDDIYLKAGNTWNLETLKITWSGTNLDRVIVDSYYMNGGSETTGVPSGTEKPTITGGYVTKTDIGTVPTGIWEGLVESSGNYVTIRNLKVINSSGFGINVNKNMHHNIVEDTETIHVSGGSIFLHRGSHSNIVRRNIVEECSWSEVDRIKPWPTHPGCIAAARSDNNIIEDNAIYSGSGEGIVIYLNSSNNVVRNNTVMGTRYVGIYIDNASDNLVENNLLLGDPNQIFSKGYSKGGISIAIEGYYPTLYNTTNNIVKNNLITGTEYCLFTDIQGPAIEQGKYMSFNFIGNTCVRTKYDIRILQNASEYTSSEIANNIFWDQSNGTASCNAPTDTDLNFHHNSWASIITDKDCLGTGDKLGDPLLQKNTGWDRSIASAVDFELLDQSPLINSGADISNLKQDFYGNTRPAIPTMGAIEIAKTYTAELKPIAPMGLSLKIIR